MGKITLTQFQKRLLSGFIIGPLVVLVIIGGGWPFRAMVLVFTLIALYEWVQISLKIKNNILYLVFGTAYVLLCFWYLYALREHFPVSTGLLFIAMIWASDIGAYFTGKKIGGPKLAPKISPNKTWAGFAGAMVFPAIIGVLLSLTLEIQAIGMIAVIGLAVGAVGQAGDLIVSVMKRRAAVKDSGSIIPGHGGLLDRVDSMMLAAPVFYFLWV
ncbi:MAG TPA: phosphatidate cytidylyltransferase, partial [Rhodospirillaceae bacterium]|nr:phosphatidate cytidylyltransferase [Rhodospirillaceae bacterium]